ncbi:ABC transporter ATP-binding protein [Candidatus Njordibacter sp. Uisw_056]|jgi:branched-chain amino acid transport system ATP-binding protein|uniref:ABC transporter ATP-binding protein n=1 Tax=Candidatus Njordibacter sp. Uisw_056 TaxID=3230973 RepID=UPI003D4C00D8|tara:strand:+ start:14826 stop:15563 length:738 start_codon:yes stop_codon:yes gene_type:complete
MAPNRSEGLLAEGIIKNFGAVSVLKNVNFEMRSNEAIGIVGPNGAGKTTFLSALAGAFVPDSGVISLYGEDVTAKDASERCKLGVVRTHQIPKPFGGMTVFENVLVAAFYGVNVDQETAYQYTLDSLSLSGMTEIANRQAENLGLLDRKRLELARALATQPKILLLDEIAGGLTDAEADELIVTIKELHNRNIGIIWIEHIVRVLLQVVDRLICMNAGEIIADGDPKTVLNNSQVVSAYLGGAAE